MAESNVQRKLLLAVDESDHSKRAFEFYLNEIWRQGDLLILLHIFNPPPPPAMSSKGKISHMGRGIDEHSHPFGHDFFLSDPKSEHWITWRKNVEDKVNSLKEYLSTYENVCKEKNVACRAILHSGSPGESICEIANERDVKLILIGCRGLNKIRRTFLGSVSDYVIHHAGKAVTVIPPPKAK